MATIIIKRKSSWIGCAQNHNVYIENDFIGELKSGGVLQITIEVGTYLLSFCSTMKKLGKNSTFNVVVNDPDEVVEIKTKFGLNGYEIKYADNKIHLPLKKDRTTQAESFGAETTSPFKNIHPEGNVVLNSFDNLDGAEFENWCANLLKNNGFTNVQVTKTSGDQGVDILALKNDIKYAIQCKCYSSNLGNSPVQEVHAGKSMYNCHVGVVMTNRHFTSGAKELANATGVLLWDRETLLQMMTNTEGERLNLSFNNDVKADTKLLDAIRIAVEEKKISTSLLQRKLEVGYSRAAQLIDKMEELGVVSKPDGTKPRKVLISAEDYIEMFVLNNVN